MPVNPTLTKPEAVVYAVWNLAVGAVCPMFARELLLDRIEASVFPKYLSLAVFIGLTMQSFANMRRAGAALFR